MILKLYKEFVDKLDLCALANEFVGGNEQRLSVFK